MHHLFKRRRMQDYEIETSIGWIPHRGPGSNRNSGFRAGGNFSRGGSAD